MNIAEGGTTDISLEKNLVSTELSRSLDAMTDAELGSLIIQMMGSEAAIALIKKSWSEREIEERTIREINSMRE
jgi:hypothetical protein